jgi:hypothetical protein
MLKLASSQGHVGIVKDLLKCKNVIQSLAQM